MTYRSRFCSFMISKGSPEDGFGNLSFFATLFLENEAQINKNNYVTILFMSKQVSLPNISSILQKMKIGPKSDIRPVLTKAFSSQPLVLHVSNKTWIPVCLSNRLPLPSRQLRMKSYLPGKSWNFLVQDDRTAHFWTLYLTIILDQAFLQKCWEQYNNIIVLVEG